MSFAAWKSVRGIDKARVGFTKVTPEAEKAYEQGECGECSHHSKRDGHHRVRNDLIEVSIVDGLKEATAHHLAGNIHGYHEDDGRE